MLNSDCQQGESNRVYNISSKICERPACGIEGMSSKSLDRIYACRGLWL